MAVFDRYSSFRNNGKVEIVPFVPIRKKSTDRYIRYQKSTMRLDRLSYEYYDSPDYGWLIMQANPEYGSLEGLIPDNVLLRIPYPLSETLNFYTSDIINRKDFY